MKARLFHSLRVALSRETPAFQSGRESRDGTAYSLRYALTRNTDAFGTGIRGNRGQPGHLPLVARCNLIVIRIIRIIEGYSAGCVEVQGDYG
jgi:hypothetical protein